VAIGENANVRDLLAYLATQYPELGKEFQDAPPHIFCGEDQISPEDGLEDNQHLHLVWPIAGG